MTIKSQDGQLHFERYRLFSSPWLRFYIHKISLPDYDLHMHGHPWNFFSLILKGSYWETYTVGPHYSVTHSKIRGMGSIVHHKRTDVHHIESLGYERPVWTFVVAYGKYETWGYRFKKSPESLGLDTWVDHQTYRKMKREGYFDAWGKLIKPVMGLN